MNDIHIYEANQIQVTFDNNACYSNPKSNCQKIQPAHLMISKRNFILLEGYFCGKYIMAEIGCTFLI